MDYYSGILVNDEFLDIEDDHFEAIENRRPPWKLLIVDDEPEVHRVTEMALAGMTFAGRPLELLHATSGAAACRRMREHADVAIILMDVVMETEHAGLEAVRVIREVLGNRHVRIILRTGQPGSAPEREVITRYDINDYKEKTELTADKLFTSVYTGLCAYRDLLALEATRQGLEQILDAASQLVKLQPRRHFFQGVLQQLTSLLRMGGSAALVRMHPGDKEPTVVAATGWLVGATGRSVSNVLGPGIQERIGRAIDAESSQTGPDHYTGFVGTPDGGVCVLYMPLDGPLSTAHRKLADGFCKALATVMENLEGLED